MSLRQAYMTKHGSRMAAAEMFARDLMRGDKESFKAGYSVESAHLAAIETFELAISEAWELSERLRSRDIRLYTFDEVQRAGNDPEVAFGPDAQFFLGPVSLVNTAPLDSYLEEGDIAGAATIMEMMEIYRNQGLNALPPVLSNANLHVEDGAHRLAAALELGWAGLPAFIEFRTAE